MKIHFASLVGVDFDLDILPFWANHYASFNFDSYTVWLHSGTGNTARLVEAQKLFDSFKWGTETISGATFRNGKLRATILGAFTSSLPKHDAIVIADSDEFHALPGHDYRTIVERYECVGGLLVDAYGSALSACNPCEPLWSQYPYSGCLGEIFARRAERKEYPERLAFPWPMTSREKIIASRCYVDVNLVGSHHIDGCHTDRKIPDHLYSLEGFSVLHYSWRASLFDRMRTKTYYDARHMWCIGKEFGMNDAELKKRLAHDIVGYEQGDGFSRFDGERVI